MGSIQKLVDSVSKLIAVALIGAAAVGCSDKEQTQTSDTFKQLPPSVARQRLADTLKKRGQLDRLNKIWPEGQDHPNQ